MPIDFVIAVFPDMGSIHEDDAVLRVQSYLIEAQTKMAMNEHSRTRVDETRYGFLGGILFISVKEKRSVR